MLLVAVCVCVCVSVPHVQRSHTLSANVILIRVFHQTDSFTLMGACFKGDDECVYHLGFSCDVSGTKYAYAVCAARLRADDGLVSFGNILQYLIIMRQMIISCNAHAASHTVALYRLRCLISNVTLSCYGFTLVKFIYRLTRRRLIYKICMHIYERTHGAPTIHCNQIHLTLSAV